MTQQLKKYRIEVEQRADMPRPWEWRVWTRRADGTFDADFDISGSEPTAADAFDEALGMLDPGGDKRAARK